MDSQIPSIIISVFVILFAITVHEAAHAWAANRLGDPTAASLGRISLNPIAHIDPIGTVILPLFMIIVSGGRGPVFGWAKPVPYNPRNLRHPRKDALWISLAGPLANVTTAGVAILIFNGLQGLGVRMPNPFLNVITGPNLPIIGLAVVLQELALVNLFLAVFNLIPIPPLDGSGILAGLLPYRAAEQFESLRRYQLLLFALLIVSHITDRIYVPIYVLVRSLFS